jgi:hypothetical protein
MTSEEIPQEINKNVYLNLAFIFIKDNDRKLHIFTQFKTLTAHLENKPYRETYRSNYLNIFNINNIFSFGVAICFSFIGKEYSNINNLEDILPYAISGKVDYLFVPQWNPKPLDYTFIKGINYVCNNFNENIAIFMINIANHIGNSSIVDLIKQKRISTTEYDLKDLEHPN